MNHMIDIPLRKLSSNGTCTIPLYRSESNPNQ